MKHINLLIVYIYFFLLDGYNKYENGERERASLRNVTIFFNYIINFVCILISGVMITLEVQPSCARLVLKKLTHKFKN